MASSHARAECVPSTQNVVQQLQGINVNGDLESQYNAIYSQCGSIQCSTNDETTAEQQGCRTTLQNIAASAAQQAHAANIQHATLPTANTSSTAGALPEGSFSAHPESGAKSANSIPSGATKNIKDLCSSAESYSYSDCDQNNENTCYGKFSSTEACTAFSQRYCSSTMAGGTVDAGSNYVTTGASGEGFGTAYCQYYTATAFCGNGGRQSCASCTNLSSYQAAACKSGSSPCLSLTSAQLASARSTCPSDPLFSNMSNVKIVQPATAQARISDIATDRNSNLFTITSTTVAQRCKDGRLNCK